MPTVKKITQNFENNIHFYVYFKDNLIKIINDLIRLNDINVHSVNGRVKDRASLIKKIDIPSLKYQTIDDVTDVVGIRIITLFSDDVDKVGRIIEEEFAVDFDNSGDKMSKLSVNSFGYRSVHYIVQLKDQRVALPEYSQFKNFKAEIQVRSILQHSWAEIEHDLIYKSYQDSDEYSDETIRSFARLAGMLETVDIEFIKIRDSLQKKISPCTPKEKINKLRKKLSKFTTKEGYHNKMVSSPAWSHEMLLDEDDALIPGFHRALENFAGEHGAYYISEIYKNDVEMLSSEVNTVSKETLCRYISKGKNILRLENTFDMEVFTGLEESDSFVDVLVEMLSFVEISTIIDIDKCIVGYKDSLIGLFRSLDDSDDFTYIHNRGISIYLLCYGYIASSSIYNCMFRFIKKFPLTANSNDTQIHSHASWFIDFFRHLNESPSFQPVSV